MLFYLGFCFNFLTARTSGLQSFDYLGCKNLYRNYFVYFILLMMAPIILLNTQQYKALRNTTNDLNLIQMHVCSLSQICQIILVYGVQYILRVLQSSAVLRGTIPGTVPGITWIIIAEMRGGRLTILRPFALSILSAIQFLVQKERMTATRTIQHYTVVVVLSVASNQVLVHTAIQQYQQFYYLSSLVYQVLYTPFLH